MSVTFLTDEDAGKFATKEFANKKSVRLPQFMNWKLPSISGAASNLIVDGKHVYVYRNGTLYKIDVSYEVEPVLADSIRLYGYVTAPSDSTLAAAVECTGMVVHGDYLYVGTRLSASGRPTAVQIAEKAAGALFILDKNTLNPINPTTGEVIDKAGSEKDGAYIPLGYKVSDVNIYGNSLIVNGQMRRWDIYDISNPTTPVLLTENTIEDFSTASSIEIQKGEVFELGDKVYYAAAGFADGVWLFDITDPTTPTQVWKYKFAGNETWVSRCHTYTLTVDYPYVYATVACYKSYLATYPIQGILTLKLNEEDISVAPTESKLSLIPTEDMNDITTGSDSMPSHIVRVGDTLVVNNDAKGIALFNITDNPGQPDYEGLYTPSDNCLIYRMKATSDGRLFLLDKGGGNRLYLIRGLSNKNE